MHDAWPVHNLVASPFCDLQLITAMQAKLCLHILHINGLTFVLFMCCSLSPPWVYLRWDGKISFHFSGPAISACQGCQGCPLFLWLCRDVGVAEVDLMQIVVLYQFAQSLLLLGDFIRLREPSPLKLCFVSFISNTHVCILWVGWIKVGLFFSTSLTAGHASCCRLGLKAAVHCCLASFYLEIECIGEVADGSWLL